MKKAELRARQEQRLINLLVALDSDTKYTKATKNGGEESYKAGCAFELWATPQNSSKIDMSKGRFPDIMEHIKGGTKHGGICSVIEVKTQEADVSKLMREYYNGRLKVDYVVYYLRVPYQKKSAKLAGEANFPLYPVIFTAEEFCQAVDRFALRKDKSNGSNREGKKEFVIQPRVKPWAEFIASGVVYSPKHIYTHDEIVGKVDVDLSDEDYEVIEWWIDRTFK